MPILTPQQQAEKDRLKAQGIHTQTTDWAKSNEGSAPVTKVASTTLGVTPSNDVKIGQERIANWVDPNAPTSTGVPMGYVMAGADSSAGYIPGVSPDWRYVPKQTGTTLTTSPLGSVSSILGDMGAGDNFYNQYYQDQLATYNAPIDETAIRKQKEAEMQAQIDAINAVYADKLRQEKTTSQGRLGSSRALQARSGLIGSDFGTAQTENVAQLNREQEQSVENERLALVSQLLSGAQKSAAEEIAAKRQAKEAGGKAYLDYLAGASTRKQEKTNKAAKLLLSLGKSPQDISDEELKQAGISRQDLTLEYTSGKTAKEAAQAKLKAEQEKAALDALKTQAEIDKIAADIKKLGADASMYYEVGNQIFEKGTNNFVGYASKLGGGRGTGGGGGGGGGGGVLPTGSYNPPVNTASSSGYNENLEVLYTKVFNTGGKNVMTAADWKTIDSLYGKSGGRQRFLAEATAFNKAPKPFEQDFRGEVTNLISQIYNAGKGTRVGSEIPGVGYLNQGVADFKSTIDSLSAKLTLDNLINLKNRGATFGALTEGEMKAIRESIAKLDGPISDAKYREILEGLNKKYGSGQAIVPRKAGETTTSTTTVAPAAGTTSTGAKFTIKTK